MRIVMFYHSLVSDWNHGNAHFLRGVATELVERGHEVRIYEPAGGWSRENLISENGEEPIRRFHRAYPLLNSFTYDETLDLDRALDGADIVIVHEWNSHDVVRRIGVHRATSRGFRLLFHDTHHRSVTDPASMSLYDLRHYDGVLAFGEAIREIYLRKGWIERAWTWHEAADTRLFHPIPGHPREGDVVWVGNWGDGERTAELDEFLLKPVERLRLSARVYGVRYPRSAVVRLNQARISYNGWLANFDVPEVFARFRCTVHVPRRPYAEALPGIPTIRPFEALACGIPLISAPWDDTEALFRTGIDYLVARNGSEMEQHLRSIVNDEGLAAELRARGRETILTRHTCAHRVDELLAICSQITPMRQAATIGVA